MLPQISFIPLSLRRPAAAGSLALAALLPAPALADGATAYIVDMVTPQIAVVSNGSEYTQALTGAELAADVRIVVDTEIGGRVKSWRAWIGLVREGYTPMWFHQYEVGKSYASGHRPRDVNLVERITVPSHAWSATATASCNDLAEELRAQGLKNAVIFGEDRTLELEVPLDYAVDTTGAGSGNVLAEGAGGSTVEVVCKKWGGFAVPQASSSLTTEEAEVVDWSLAVSETAGLSGVCKIRLTGAIATDHLNVDVSFRYKDKAGHESQVWTVNTGNAKFATFSHWYNVPNGEGPETGSVRMVGVSHPFRSAWVDYEMNCVQGGPNTLANVDPPKVKIKSVEAEGKRMVNGQICPERLRLVGEVEGRDNYSGYAAFVATSGPLWLSPPQAYDLDDGETQLVVGYYPLWTNAAVLVGSNEPISIERSFVFRATDANNAIVASADHTYTHDCVPPKRNPAVGGTAGDFGVQPRQPAAPTAAPRLQQQTPSATPQLILPRRQLKQAN